MPSLARPGHATTIDGLYFQVQLIDDGWRYQISRNKKNQILQAWCITGQATASVYMEPESTKFGAVGAALLELGRDGEDPHEVFGTTMWHLYVAQQSG